VRVRGDRNVSNAKRKGNPSMEGGKVFFRMIWGETLTFWDRTVKEEKFFWGKEERDMIYECRREKTFPLPKKEGSS